MEPRAACNRNNRVEITNMTLNNLAHLSEFGRASLHSRPSDNIEEDSSITQTQRLMPSSLM